jgi:hypothetical protein
MMTASAHTAAPTAPAEELLAAPPAPRSRRRGRAALPDVPLGSLTQREHQARTECMSCGSTRVTKLAMSLTDGTPVDFTSCHRCEHRTWEHDGVPLSVQTVLERTQKS